MDCVRPDPPQKDDAAGALHIGCLFEAHRGDLVDNGILGLCLNTDIRHVVRFVILHG